MMYPDGWPFDQHNIVLYAEDHFLGSHCNAWACVLKPPGQHFSAHAPVIHVPGFLKRFAHFTPCYVGLKTRIIAQVLAYALTAIEREPELGTIIATTKWAKIRKKVQFTEAILFVSGQAKINIYFEIFF